MPTLLGHLGPGPNVLETPPEGEDTPTVLGLLGPVLNPISFRGLRSIIKALQNLPV
jgi:hypothetical protein